MTFLESLISSHKNKGLVIDTNLLLLLFIGSFEKSHISKFKRTETYTERDYDYLLQFVNFFKIITTPNILTEVVNLSKTHNDKTSGKLFMKLFELINIPSEQYIKSSDVMNKVFLNFGLTDSIIHHLSEKGCLILTDDLPLYSYLSNQGLCAINFNHIRSEYLLTT